VKIFDAQIRSGICSDADLQNLHYFETERVVTTAHAPHPFDRAEDLLEYFDDLTTEECSRLERLGLRAYVALGVLPAARPRRAHFEVWRELPYLLQQPEVVAVGEIGAWEDTDAHWELFERQVKIAREAGPIPIIATPPVDLRVNMTYKMMQRVEKLDMPAELVLMNRLDERLIETVVREGFVAGVSVGSPNFEPRKAAEILAELVDRLGSAERIVLDSSLRTGGADVLGIPKTIVAMQDRNMSMRTIERLAYGNAMALFVRQMHHLE
jgi:predicted metal-dependent TIM-barrel fold hydrolase